MSIEDFLPYHDRALADAKAHFPSAPIQQWYAFANALASYLAKDRGGTGGPSMREQYASDMLKATATQQDRDLTYEEARALIVPVCFGPLTIEIARMMHEHHTFDNPPGEREAARRLLASEPQHQH